MPIIGRLGAKNALTSFSTDPTKRQIIGHVVREGFIIEQR